MLSGIIKYSDERNKRYSIKTSVINDKEPYVIKECIFQEGEDHIKNIYANQAKLECYYPNVKICKGTMLQKKIIKFEFVDGISLEEKYISAVKSKDKETFEKLLLEHKNIIVGSEKNQCEFCISDDFNKIFGGGQAYVGREGLRLSNFDGIPSNIIYNENDEPNFIDYEWVMDFVMPLELVLYNCINNLYLKNTFVNEFYSQNEAMKYVGIQIDLNTIKESYNNFFQYIISELDGKSYAKDKISCLKPLDTIEGIRIEWQKCADEWKKAVSEIENRDKELLEVRTEWQKCADEWKKAVSAIEDRDKELLEVRTEWQKCADEWTTAVDVIREKEEEILEIRTEWQKCANEWKNTSEALKERENQLEEARREWRNCANEWKETVHRFEEIQKELLQVMSERDQYKTKYENIVNSKSWKMLTRLKKPFVKG